MKPETKQWVRKAEGDWSVAERERQTEHPVWDVVCFLCQQCAEKYIKAFLEERSRPFKKTHDLAFLLGTAGEELSELRPLEKKLARLSTFGIAARYPGAEADEKLAEEALETARAVRTAMREKLGLKPFESH